MDEVCQLLATTTSVYGSILKVDSIKKVCKKLHRAAAGSTTWVINVGNDRREILISMITDLEGQLTLKLMADGLTKRLC